MRVKLNKYLSTKEFISNKFRELIIPYLITSIMFMIPMQMMSNVYTDNESFLYRILYDLLLAKHPGYLWYLIMAFNIFVIFRVIERNINKNSYITNLIFLFIFNIISVFIPNTYQISNTFKCLLYFYIGYVCSEKREEILRCNPRLLFIAHFMLFNFRYLLLSNIEGSILGRDPK